MNKLPKAITIPRTVDTHMQLQTNGTFNLNDADARVNRTTLTSDRFTKSAPANPTHNDLNETQSLETRPKPIIHRDSFHLNVTAQPVKL